MPPAGPLERFVDQHPLISVVVLLVAGWALLLLGVLALVKADS